MWVSKAHLTIVLYYALTVSTSYFNSLTQQKKQAFLSEPQVSSPPVTEEKVWWALE